MKQDRQYARGALYALFTLSGLAGLIYESIWAQYLKLFLGHAAYAQTLVLAIFMGGMAIGAWAAGDVARRAARPLAWYAAVEGLLGLAALGFDPLFRAMQSFVFQSAIPALESPLAIDLVKWVPSALIILPQSILLGATFPLMSAGVVRLYPGIAGSALSWLYFTNSAGASVGVLLSGYFLIDHVGLPGTLLTAGLINFLLALAVMGIVRSSAPQPTAQPMRPEAPNAALATPALMLAAAFFTGAASFFYEIGWIRMLSLVLGSATHSFELMLSAFILGLALGSYRIRGRIDTLPDPLRTLGRIQVVMALCAFLSLPLYMKSFDVMAGFWHAVQSNDGGYVLFTLCSYVICFGLMLPATFCAGMTLPLMTAMLLRAGHGERSIGRIYASNTLGAIAGILAAVHLVLPLLGLRQVVVVGALLDFGLGLWLLARVQPRWQAAELALAGAAAALGLAIVATVQFDPHVTASGVYRIGNARLDADILYQADGKTASVDVARFSDGTLSIATNGKVDAGLNIHGPTGADDYTMLMLALLSMSMEPQARTAAVIGMGSGTSTNTLLYNPHLKRVDTIEIEPAMVEGARFFADANRQVFEDLRSHVEIEDAKTYFARAHVKYDLILSEPSNPWVSGIASLFSREFYDQAKRHLTADGLFVQWLHLYEIDVRLIATVMNALGASFDDYAVFSDNGDDITIIARPSGRLPELQPWIFDGPALQPPLQRLGMRGLADLQIRKLGSKATLAPFFADQGVPANSDYFPILDQGSGRQRFKISNARNILQIHPYALRLEGTPQPLSGALAAPLFQQPIPGLALRARSMAARILGREDQSGYSLPADLALLARVLGTAHGPCAPSTYDDVWFAALRRFVTEAAAYLPPAIARDVVKSLREGPCAAQLPEGAQAWIGLLEGISQSDYAQVRRLGAELLPRARNSETEAQFLQAEILTADLLAGDLHAAAGQIRHVTGLPENYPLQYLRAQVEAGLLREHATSPPPAPPKRS